MTDSSKKAIITLAAIVVVAAIGTLIYYVASDRTGEVARGWLHYKPGMHELKLQPIPAARQPV